VNPVGPIVRNNRDVLTADSLARFAAVLADRSRAGICLALLDRRAWTAGELARHVGVARSTASAHLTVLVSAGLLAEERQGDTATCASPTPRPPSSSRTSQPPSAYQAGRPRCAPPGPPASSPRPGPATTTSPASSA
jgi:hypothetical protein